MKLQSQRKLTRFYVINPVSDRRFEQRFESREDLMIRFDRVGRSFPAVGYDISRRGIRIETAVRLEPGMELQLVFPEAPDHIRCFGRVVWARPFEDGYEYEGGVAVDAWYGVVEGEDSWKKYKGFRPKRDRRLLPR